MGTINSKNREIGSKFGGLCSVITGFYNSPVAGKPFDEQTLYSTNFINV